MAESKPSTSSYTSVQWSQPCRQIEYPEILSATENFNESLVIGCGGFGKVYKGNINNGSKLVVAAFKRLDSMSNQGETEFWAEVEMLSKLRHAYLVSLIGYCSYEKEFILVYEYMSNGTLSDHLHKLGTCLSWLRRLRICIGAGRGLDYLHTGTGIEFGVIHRDVKSSNILINERWAAKVSDFGLSRIGPVNQPSTYVNTLIKGTFGYLDPNYFATGKLTRKSDVYAFGVVLLEVLCRKKPLDPSLDWGLASWALDSIKEGNLKHIIDYDIKSQISPKCIKEFVRIAQRCLDNHPKHRPTMGEVVVCLETILTLQEKIVTSLQTTGKTFVGRMVDMFPFTSRPQNSKILISSIFEDMGIAKSLIYDFSTIKEATNDFSEENKLGRGGFGAFYRGALRDGQVISVKLLSRESGQGDAEFKNEVLLVPKLRHDNVARLLGFSIEGNERLLIYEFFPNGSLDHFIFDPTKQRLLNWERRYKIINGIAKGLLYIHEDSRLGIIHRDLTASSVLLDAEMNPKIGGFGMARLLKLKETHGDTSRIIGTYGYMAPEYALHGNFSVKSDVFSFGVLVLEMITGQKNQSFEIGHLLSFAWECWKNGTTLLDMIHPILKTESDSLSEIIRSIHIGLLCVQNNVIDRPTTASLVQMLNSFSITLPMPFEPAFYMSSNIDYETPLFD